MDNGTPRLRRSRTGTEQAPTNPQPAAGGMKPSPYYWAQGMQPGGAQSGPRISQPSYQGESTKAGNGYPQNNGAPAYPSYPVWPGNYPPQQNPVPPRGAAPVQPKQTVPHQPQPAQKPASTAQAAKPAQPTRSTTRASVIAEPPAPSKATSRSSAAKKNEKRGTSPKKKKKGTGLKAALIVVILLAVIAGGVYLYAKNTLDQTEAVVAPFRSTYYPGVTVDGIDLTGKSKAEGEALVWNQVNEKKNAWSVRIRDAGGNYLDINAGVLGIDFDPTQALAEAWKVGHSFDASQSTALFPVLDEKTYIDSLRGGRYHFSSAEQSADLSTLDRLLETLETRSYQQPTDAVFLGFDPDNMSEPFSFQSETYGSKLNATAAREQLYYMVENLQSGEVVLETETIAPQVTVADLKKHYSLRFTATTPISSHSSQDRTDNIRTAFSRFNGMVLDPGKTFSFNKKVGKRTLENGFLPALEYSYGAESWGIGGGVCQASTTLYLAAIQSGLRIGKRVPHSMEVSYTDFGMDATVSDTKGREIDFTFTNNTDEPIYITAHVVKSKKNRKNLMCEVSIYGKSLETVSYKLVTETVEILPKPTEPVTVKDKNQEFVTYTDQTKTEKGHDGCVVASYLIRYDNNYEMERVKVGEDTYKPHADTIYVGTKERD